MQSGQPPFPEPVPLSLADDRLHRVFRVSKAFIVPLVLTSLQSCLQVGNLISLCEIQALCLRPLKLCPPELHLQLRPPFFYQCPGLLLSNLSSFFLVLHRGLHYILESFFSFSVLNSLPQPPINKMGQLHGLIA